MRYTFRLVFPYIEDEEITVVNFSLAGANLDEAIRSGDDELPLTSGTILLVTNEHGDSAHVKLGFERSWNWVDVAHTID